MISATTLKSGMAIAIDDGNKIHPATVLSVDSSGAVLRYADMRSNGLLGHKERRSFRELHRRGTAIGPIPIYSTW